MAGWSRYRPHWITWLTVLLVGGALGWCHLAGGSGRLFLPDGGRGRLFGWPWNQYQCFEHIAGASMPNPRIWITTGSSARAAAANLAVSLLILTCVAATAEKFSRKPSPPLQMELRTVFVIITVIACLIALVQAEGRWGRTWLHHPLQRLEYNSLNVHAWPIRLAILFGLGCIVYTAGMLTVRLVARTRAEKARNARRSPEARACSVASKAPGATMRAAMRKTRSCLGQSDHGADP